MTRAHVVAVFLVPLHHGAADHGGAFQGDDPVELALADDHAAGVLAEMPRQFLHALTELQVFGDAAMAKVEAGVLKLVAERLAFLPPLPLTHEAEKGGRGCRL